MVMKFVAPDIALAFHHLFSWQTPWIKKACFLGGKPASAYVYRRRIVALYAQMAREAEHVHSFFRCVIAECLN